MWYAYSHPAPGFCTTCGAPVIMQCPDCAALLPAYETAMPGQMYHPHCGNCGKAYPWRAVAIARANRELNELAEVEEWEDAVKERARELIGDIASDNVSASGVRTAIKWMEQRGGEGAGKLVMWTVRAIGSAALAKTLFG